MRTVDLLELSYDQQGELFFIFHGFETRSTTYRARTISQSWIKADRPLLFVDEEGHVHAKGFYRFDRFAVDRHLESV